MGEILTVGGVALAIFAIIAAGVAAMRTADVKSLREANDDLRSRATDLETERDDYKAKLSEEQLRHKVTRGDLEALGRVITGEAHWVALEQQLDHHHDETVTRLDRIIAALRKRTDQ